MLNLVHTTDTLRSVLPSCRDLVGPIPATRFLCYMLHKAISIRLEDFQPNQLPTSPEESPVADGM